MNGNNLTTTNKKGMIMQKQYIPYTGKSPLAPREPGKYPVPAGQGKYFGMKGRNRVVYCAYDPKFKTGQRLKIGNSNYVVGPKRNLIGVR